MLCHLSRTLSHCQPSVSRQCRVAPALVAPQRLWSPWRRRRCRYTLPLHRFLRTAFRPPLVAPAGEVLQLLRFPSRTLSHSRQSVSRQPVSRRCHAVPAREALQLLPFPSRTLSRCRWSVSRPCRVAPVLEALRRLWFLWRRRRCTLPPPSPAVLALGAPLSPQSLSRRLNRWHHTASQRCHAQAALADLLPFWSLCSQVLFPARFSAPSLRASPSSSLRLFQVSFRVPAPPLLGSLWAQAPNSPLRLALLVLCFRCLLAQTLA